MEKIDDIRTIAVIAIAVAVVAITLSAGIVGYSYAKMQDLEARVQHAEGSVDLLDVRYTNLQAYLQARGIEVPQ